MTTKAAGILFLSPQGNSLFLRRIESAPDFPNFWDFPGGGSEGDESAEQTAVREAEEECGAIPKGVRNVLSRTLPQVVGQKGVAANGAGVPQVGAPLDVDFTTFLQRVDSEFTPKLNDEHDGWAWAPITSPPQPLHPGCQIALDRLNMDELGVARAIAEGLLPSPQRYENVMLWAIRITGTGGSFRPKDNEFVYRDANIHLNPDALARWNGAPVVMRHPKKGLLDSKEFGETIVGTIFLPYVSGDEAWGIAKIFDDDANRLMQEEELSTSPGVNFRNFAVNRTLRLEDGSKVLVEGKPSLHDHVAICERGVWDKGGEPGGIRSEAREDSAMADEDKKEEHKDDAKKMDAKADAHKDDAHKDDAAKKDAKKDEVPDDKLSHVLDAVKSMTDAVSGLSRRMDALEDIEKAKDDKKKRHDADEEEDRKKKEEAEKTAADKAKKDAKKDDEHRDDRHKDDAHHKDDRKDARTDSTADDIRIRILALESQLRDHGDRIKPLGDDDYHLLAEAWSRADEVFSSLGHKTPRAMPGESSIQYRRRTIKLLRPLSPTWKDVSDEVAGKSFADEAPFSVMEKQVLAEAAKAALDPATAQPGALRMIERKHDGHIVREFVGQPRTWMDPMAGATQLRVTGNFARLDGTFA